MGACVLHMVCKAWTWVSLYSPPFLSIVVMVGFMVVFLGVGVVFIGVDLTGFVLLL